MPWKLARWKPCDGGCCVRSPRFPRAQGGPDNTRPAWLADCIYHENQPGGISPDGTEWRGGCTLYTELLGVIASRGGVNNVRIQDLRGLNNFGRFVRGQEPPPNHRTFRGNTVQWFLDTCWKWPVMTPTITALINRAKALGIFQDDPGFSAVLAYETEYTDEQRVALGQEFHVTHEQVVAGTAVNEEPACCHYWQQV